MISRLVSTLNDSFSIRDLASFTYFLGFEARSASPTPLHLSQTRDIQDILTRAKMKPNHSIGKKRSLFFVRVFLFDPSLDRANALLGFALDRSIFCGFLPKKLSFKDDKKRKAVLLKFPFVAI